MPPTQIRRWAAAGALAGVVALSGCGSEERESSSPAQAEASTPTPAASAVPAAARGSWQRTIRTRDWRPVGTGYPVGRWRLDLGPAGTADVYLPHTDAIDFSTQFTVDGNRLTIDTVPICPGKNGRYTIRASGDQLRLTAVSDPGCPPRAVLFGGTWTRRR